LDWGPNDVLEAARYWSTQIAAGLAAEAAFGDSTVVRVRYEDLVNEPEQTLRLLCAALDVPYSRAMLEPRDYNLPSFTARQHALVPQAADHRRANAWRHKLSADEIRAFEFETGELLGYLGYSLDYGPTASRPSALKHAGSATHSVFRRLVTNRIRRWRRLGARGMR
jgi:hypothetical protein